MDFGMIKYQDNEIIFMFLKSLIIQFLTYNMHNYGLRASMWYVLYKINIYYLHWVV